MLRCFTVKPLKKPLGEFNGMMGDLALFQNLFKPAILSNQWHNLVDSSLDLCPHKPQKNLFRAAAFTAPANMHHLQRFGGWRLFLGRYHVFCSNQIWLLCYIKFYCTRLLHKPKVTVFTFALIIYARIIKPI